MRTYGLDTRFDVDSTSIEIRCPTCAAPTELHQVPLESSSWQTDWAEWKVSLPLSTEADYAAADTTTWGGWPHEPTAASSQTSDATLIYSAWSGDEVIACVARGLEAEDWRDQCDLVDPFVDYDDSLWADP